MSKLPSLFQANTYDAVRRVGFGGGVFFSKRQLQSDKKMVY